MLWTTDWKMWLIDHTRTPEAVETAFGDVLSWGERSSVMRRRDLLLQHFDGRIARFGERGVVVDPEPAP